MKKTLTLVLLLAISALSQQVAAHDVEVDGIYYNLNTSAKTAADTFQGSSYSSSAAAYYTGDVTIPSTFVNPDDNETYTVTSIGERAFYYCSSVTSVTMPSTVTSIGGVAFQHCSSMTEVNFSDKITSIADWSFGNCSSLVKIELPEELATIGGSAFRSCSALKTVIAGSKITRIYDMAFNGCSNLTTFVLNCTTPPTLDEYSTYYNFTNSSIMIFVPEESISAYQSATNWSRTSTAFVDIDVFTDENQLSYSASGVTIDGLVYNLSGYGATLTTGNQSCTGDIVIPATVQYNTGSANYNFFVNGINNSAFEHASITSVKINSPYLSSISSWAFGNSSTLATVEIPYVTTLKGSSFRGSSSLTTVIAGDKLETIESQTFEDCSKLECFVINRTNAPTLSEWSSTHSSHLTFKVNDVVFFVPTEAIDSYKASSNWSYYNFVYQDIDKYTDSQLGYTASGVTVNGIKYDISGYKATITQGNKNSTITDVFIPAVIEYVDGSNTYTCKVKETKTAAFQNSSAIKTFNFESPTRLTSFGGWYFAGCSNLVEINLPEGITTLLNDYALGRMDNITKLTLPTTLTTIPNYTFYNDPKLTVIEFKSETPPTFSGSSMFKGSTVQGNITIVVPTEDAVTAYTTALASYTPENFKAVITKDQYVTQSIEENNGVVTISGLVDEENIDDMADYISNNYSTATSVDMTNATILPSIEKEDVAVLQPTSSNILVYAPSETYNDLSGANIIIDGTCSNLVLTDKKDFAPTGAFTATAGTVSRQLYAGLNTVCMPFAFSASDISSEAKVYTYSETRENTLSFTEVDNVEAGVPCLVEIPEGTATANYSIALSGASVAAAPASASPLVGTFVKQTLGTGKYKLNDEGKFVKTVAESVLWPFRFCLDISGAASNTFAITFSDDDPTSVNSVAEEQGVTDVVSIYGEDGVKRASLQKGINILKFANGKIQKVFIK